MVSSAQRMWRGGLKMAGMGRWLVTPPGRYVFVLFSLVAVAPLGQDHAPPAARHRQRTHARL